MASRGLYCILALHAYVGICFGKEVLLPQSFNGAVNDKVVFTPVKLPSPPYDKVQWNFNQTTVVFFNGLDVFIKDSYRERAFMNITSFALELKNLNMNDAGLYTLTVKSFLGTTQLNVFEPVSNVSITPREMELVEVNSTARLNCTASGSSLSFYWLNGSSELTVGGRVQLMDGNTTLIITSVSRDDFGPYRCGAFNQISKDMSQNLTLTIYYGPDKATVEAAPVGPFYISGYNITLRCSAESSPAALIQWAVNGAVLDSQGPELKLANVQTNQSGSYTCMAHNTKSLRYSTSEPINIIVLETISQVTLNNSIDFLIEGSSFSNLTCEGSGTVLSTEWMKDNQILSPSNSITFSADNKTVLIGPVRRSDSGVYQCTLSNPVSSDTANYRMTVNYGPDKVVIDGPSEVEMEEKNVTFLCITASVPAASYTWEFNGRKTNVTTASFTVESVNLSHSGKYTCIAQNHVTKLRALGSHDLVLKAKGSDGNELSAGIIAAIVIGVLLVFTGVTGLVIYFTKSKGRLNSSATEPKNIRANENGEQEINYAQIQKNQTVGNTSGTNMQTEHGTLDVKPHQCTWEKKGGGGGSDSILSTAPEACKHVVNDAKSETSM